MIVALQYHKKDRKRTLTLARLLADIEPFPRDDILLAFVCQPDTPTSNLTEPVLQYCSLKFPTTHVVVPKKGGGHPEGPGLLWAGTMEHFHKLFEQGLTSHDSIMTLDGGDGVPLHRNWIDLIIKEHTRTLKNNKLITGTPSHQGPVAYCPLHVNPNAIFHLSIWSKEPSLHTIPRSNGTLFNHFDIYHRRIMLNNASLSSVIKTDWRGNGNRISPGLMQQEAARAVWLHGYKDDDLYSIAREHLLALERVPPDIRRHQLSELYIIESCRKAPERLTPCPDCPKNSVRA